MMMMDLGLPTYGLCIWMEVMDYLCLGLGWLINSFEEKELSLGLDCLLMIILE